MRKTNTKFLSAILALIMALSLVPSVAFAEEMHLPGEELELVYDEAVPEPIPPEPQKAESEPEIGRQALSVGPVDGVPVWYQNESATFFKDAVTVDIEVKGGDYTNGATVPVNALLYNVSNEFGVDEEFEEPWARSLIPQLTFTQDGVQTLTIPTTVLNRLVVDWYEIRVTAPIGSGLSVTKTVMTIAVQEAPASLSCPEGYKKTITGEAGKFVSKNVPANQRKFEVLLEDAAFTSDEPYIYLDVEVYNDRDTNRNNSLFFYGAPVCVSSNGKHEIPFTQEQLDKLAPGGYLVDVSMPGNNLNTVDILYDVYRIEILPETVEKYYDIDFNIFVDNSLSTNHGKTFKLVHIDDGTTYTPVQSGSRVAFKKVKSGNYDLIADGYADQEIGIPLIDLDGIFYTEYDLHYSTFRYSVTGDKASTASISAVDSESGRPVKSGDTVCYLRHIYLEVSPSGDLEQYTIKWTENGKVAEGRIEPIYGTTVILDPINIVCALKYTEGKTLIEPKMSYATTSYGGSPQNAAVDMGGIPANCYILQYRRAGTSGAYGSAPTDAGAYNVRVSLTSEGQKKYTFANNKTVYDFTQNFTIAKRSLTTLKLNLTGTGKIGSTLTASMPYLKSMTGITFEWFEYPNTVLSSGAALSHTVKETSAGKRIGVRAIAGTDCVNYHGTVYADGIDIESKGEHLVTFNANGGTLTGTRYIMTVDGKPVFPNPAPTRMNFLLSHWNTKSDGSGQNVTANTQITAPTTVYAIWKVDDSIVSVKNITIGASGNKKTIAVGETLQLTAAVLPSNATYKDVVWSIPYTERFYATVSDKGLVRGLSSGTVTVTATAVQNEKISATYTIKITDTPEVPVISSVTGVKVSPNTYNSLKITWNRMNDVDGYYIYRTPSGGKAKSIKRLVGNANTSYIDKGLPTGGVYYYRVLAYKNVEGQVVRSTNKIKPTGKTVQPAHPTSVKAKAYTGSKIRLTWKKSAGASGYYLQRATSKNGNYKTIKTLTSINSYTDAKLTAGRTYYYRLVPYTSVSGKKVSGVSSAVVSGKAIA